MSSNSGWAYGLLKAIEETKNCVISNNELVVIKDKFPKAEFHFLVIPKQNISSIFEVTSPNFPHFRKKMKFYSSFFCFFFFNQLDTSKLKLLNEMYLMALNVIEVNGRKPDEFLIGYHANPSMLQLHLHVISTDFNSSFLKTKKHFNSFNTEFFISHESECTTVLIIIQLSLFLS